MPTHRGDGVLLPNGGSQPLDQYRRVMRPGVDTAPAGGRRSPAEVTGGGRRTVPCPVALGERGDGAAPGRRPGELAWPA